MYKVEKEQIVAKNYEKRNIKKKQKSNFSKVPFSGWHLDNIMPMAGGICVSSNID